ncbi:MAG: DEAD/DEAH box helicase family protein [Chthoniobacterales bacterium]
MIALKPYQSRVLESLEQFFRETSRDGRPEKAFHSVQERNAQQPLPYLPVHAEGLAAEMPYVCLRVPTGGGKTLLACHAAGLALKDLLHAERGVVLWLVPSNTILNQTADALRDPRHDYRRALELACGPVEVMTIEEALQLSRATVEGRTVVIVATIQSFRAEDTTGRKVYAQNGAFQEHFLNLPSDRVSDLLKGPKGKPIPSLVNMLRLRRPVVIVDEAHNARTDLSFTTLGSVLPSCILEFTATPARKGTLSNVLHRVSAAELKAAQRVKLPLRVITRHPSQKETLLAEAITLRSDLEKLALAESQKTGEYLRPIMLLQAETVAECEPLRKRLEDDFGISKEEVKISVGALDELPSAEEIRSPKCPVRFLVTVQKLREGWDCPFAYVLCSLKESRSATAIEQIVGRVLRLPGAKTKHHADLNCSYVFSVSPSITTVLAELRDALESNGFTKAEAERIIIPVEQGALPLASQPRTIVLSPSEINTTAVAKEVTALHGKIRVDEAKGEITVLVPLDEEETERLIRCVSTPEAKERVKETVKLVREAEKAFGGTGETREPSGYERQLDFIVPLLCVNEQGRLLEFESTFLMEHPWKLSAKDAALAESYNPTYRPKGKSGTLDVDGRGAVESAVTAEALESDFVVTLHQQVLQLGGTSDWTLEALVSWLDRNINHQDIPPGESAEFLRKVIRGLMALFEINDLTVLALDRYRLRDEVERCIEKHRKQERKEALHDWLLPGSALSVTEDRAINFKTMGYEPSWLYDGGFQFKKHYFGTKPGELNEKRSDGKQLEEFQCAQYLDGLPEVEFWFRNLSKKASSFRLQTSTDWFHPDFVCKLTDGRILVVEYKGEHLWEGAEENRAVGEVWASRSNGKCLFVMPRGNDLAAIKACIS